MSQPCSFSPAHFLAKPEEDCLGALEGLAEEVGATAETSVMDPGERPPLPKGGLTAERVWRTLAALMPEGAIVSDQGVTSSRDAHDGILGAPPHDMLNIPGRAIDQGLPMAAGAALSCPDHQVFAMESDGAGMYNLQALWTQARKRLDVVTVIFANGAYRLLQGELMQMGTSVPGPRLIEAVL